MTSARQLAGSLNRLLDYPAPPRRFLCPHDVWFGSVYRARNSEIVGQLLAPLERRGWDVHLWALDVVSSSLEGLTRDVGPGAKFQLLQRLLDASPPPPSSWVVLSDDDYRFRRGSLVDLLAIAQAASFDVAQPAHRRFVNASHHITLVRPRVIARRTHFVEIGPVVVMSPVGQAALLPFPEARMGWGLEARWSKSSLNGEVVLGIVDSVTIEHLESVGKYYDQSAARAEYDHHVKEAGLRSLEDVRINVAWWRRRQRRPPWSIR